VDDHDALARGQAVHLEDERIAELGLLDDLLRLLRRAAIA